MDVSASSKQASARPRRNATYCYGCLPQQGDSIRDLARRLGYDLDRLDGDGLPVLTVAEGEQAIADLHADGDWGDQPRWRQP